ncbi:unnamed protein product [Prunus armeniaca]|uniref:Uncharacterized protein n=1 Tax=Prunus armeniaca TaxID=36596 RepID=A0A6J5V9E3_PRUAR|nr:unnamed protein product [Prunus armeniaca]
MGPPLTVNNKEELSPPQALNGSLPKYGHRGINWDLISVEIGFTVGFGVSVGSLVLCKRWSKWYHKAMYRMILKIFPQLEERIGIHRRHVHINRRWRVEEQCSWTPIHGKKMNSSISMTLLSLTASTSHRSRKAVDGDENL